MSDQPPPTPPSKGPGSDPDPSKEEVAPPTPPAGSDAPQAPTPPAPPAFASPVTPTAPPAPSYGPPAGTPNYGPPAAVPAPPFSAGETTPPPAYAAQPGAGSTPPPGAVNYGAPGYTGAPATGAKAPVLSIISLVAGIVSFLFGWIVIIPIVGSVLQLFLPIGAIVLGFLGKAREPHAAKGLWLTGIILGFIGLLVAIIGFIVWGLIFANYGSYDTYNDFS